MDDGSEGLCVAVCFSCKIDWKTGKDVTVAKVFKMKHDKTQGFKIVSKVSFFNFFSPSQPGQFCC